MPKKDKSQERYQKIKLAEFRNKNFTFSIHIHIITNNIEKNTKFTT